MSQQCIHDLPAVECAVCNGAEQRQYGKKAPPAERYADAVFDLIPVQEEGWISQSDLADKAGLTGAQVGSAVAYLRDNYPELPLVSSASGYCYTLDEADVNRFRLARTRSALTTYRRLWRGVIKPFIDKSVDRGYMPKREAEFLSKQYDRLLDDLETMAS